MNVRSEKMSDRSVRMSQRDRLARNVPKGSEKGKRPEKGLEGANNRQAIAKPVPAR